MPKILVSDAISQSGLDFLESSGTTFDYRPELSNSELLKIVGQYEALIVRSRTKVSRDVLEKAGELKVIGRAGVGLDNIDTEAAREMKITVVNTPNALTNAVAEFTIGLMLSLARKIPIADSNLRQSNWTKSSLIGTELKSKTYGTIGIGRIGARVSELAHAFGMQILANDVIPVPDELIKRLHIRVVEQQEIFEQSDFVDLHVPLTQETTYLANYEMLSSMKPSAFLINTSRGKVVNECDLLRALNEGKIAGAALDVFETEPNILPELLKNQKLVLTPHIAGQTQEAQDEAGLLIAEAVVEKLKNTLGPRP